MTEQQVQDVFGKPGATVFEMSGMRVLPTQTARSWANPDGTNAVVLFEDGRLTTKAQIGLR